MGNVTDKDKLKEINKIVRELEHGWDGDTTKLKKEKLQHIRWLSDKED